MAILLRDDYDYRDPEPADFLLKRQITTVLLACPAHLGHGSRLMSDQVAFQALGQTLIKQDSHERTGPVWPVPGPRPLVLALP